MIHEFIKKDYKHIITGGCKLASCVNYDYCDREQVPEKK
jgi:hypothetical protein